MVKSDKNAKNRRRDVFTASKIRRLIRRAVIFWRIFGGKNFGGEFADRRGGWGSTVPWLCRSETFKCTLYKVYVYSL